MKKLLSFLTFLLVFGIAIQANAAPVVLTNGSFESGDLTGWDPTPNDTASVVDPTDTTNWSGYPSPNTGNGSYYAEIIAETTGYYDNDPSDPSDPGYFGYKGYISQSISYDDGDTLSFDWIFLFVDGTQWDYAYYKIGDQDEEKFFIQAGNGAPPDYWQTYTITFSGTGSNVNLEFGVVGFPPVSTSSRLLIDTATPVPEPASLILLASGLLAIVGARRRI